MSATRTSLAFALAVLALGAATPASRALTVVEDRTLSKVTRFVGDTCGAPAVVKFPLPQGASSIEISEPIVGDPLWSDSDELIHGEVTRAAVDRGGRRPKLTWEATGDAGLCFPDGDGWEADAMRFVAFYRLRREVVLGGRGARRYARRALRRTFGSAFTYGYAHSYRCRRASDIRVRCHAGWVIGDVSYGGPVTIWLSKRAGALRWNYSLSIIRVNEYCLVVQGSDCRRLVMRSRTGLVP